MYLQYEMTLGVSDVNIKLDGKSENAGVKGRSRGSVARTVSERLWVRVPVGP